jgi:hypothetical protein
MLIDLIYSVPTWKMTLAVTAVFVGVSVLGLVIVARLMPLSVRLKHNELAGFNSQLVGVIFAVLLAFIAVAAWESFGKAGDIAATEAALTGDLARDALAMPEPVRSELVDDIRDYVAIVLTREWPEMARGAPVGDEGWVPLRKFHQDLISIRTIDPVQVAIFSETLSRLNLLYDARRSRLLAAQDHIEPAVWWVMLIGSAVMIGFTFLFGMERFGMHMLMTVVVAASLALVIALIAAFDYPFRGQVQIGPNGFEAVQHTMEIEGIKFGPGG